MKLAPVYEDVIRLRLEELFAEKPIEQWGPISLASALMPPLTAILASEQRQHAKVAFDAAIYSGCPTDYIAQEISDAVAGRTALQGEG